MFMRYWGGGPGHIGTHTAHRTPVDAASEVVGDYELTEENEPDQWEATKSEEASDSEGLDLE
jgi:hypothetical protein